MGADVLLAAFIEGVWAWYKPDFFLSLSATSDTDQLVLQTNNYFQNLYRSALQAGLHVDSPAMRQLDGTMAAWEKWKAEYDQAILHWTPFGRDWAEELDEWRHEWIRSRDLLQHEAGDLLKQQLAERGIDPNFVKIEEPGLIDRVREAIGETAGDITKQASKGMLVPVAGAALFGLALVWIVARASHPRY